MVGNRDPLLVLAGVSHSYGLLQTVLPGQCIAFLSVNGSGNSTLQRIAAGRDTPTTGQVSYCGKPLKEDALVARRDRRAGGAGSC